MTEQTPDHSNKHSAARKPLAILQVIPSLDAGGAERTTLDIAAAIIKAGGSAVVASRGGRMTTELIQTGATFIPLSAHSKNPYTIYRNISALSHIIRDYGITLIHARSRAPAWSSYYAARQCAIPFITTYHGTYNASGPVKRLYNSIMVKGDRIIANSSFIAEHIVKEHSPPSSKLVTIPRGLDLSQLNPDKTDPDAITALRQQWNLTDDRPVILLPGRLTRWKGQKALIESCALLRERGRTDFVCVLAGDAQGRLAFEQELREFIGKLNLGDCVRIVGHCNDMLSAYAVADVVVSASIEPEAFGRIAIEAQAMSRPVIVTDHGGSKETVIDGFTGWRVAPGDPEALAQSIDATLSLSGEACKSLGRNARAHVLKNYSVEQMCTKTIALYQSVQLG